ncbi:MAG: nitrous oxide reductase accessory protein NosL [Aliarcobacter sp.]|nr:nitrous oxide reductase accessory protein NosL [Aliarcobacter sp.]
MKKSVSLLMFLFAIFFANLNAQEMFQTVDPKDATLVKTDSSKEFCNVCGMHLTKYYKTNHATEFKNGHKEQYCSIHCQAQIEDEYADKIRNIQVVDTNSLKFIDAKNAFYVVGSSKPGTMSPVSKYAFSTKDAATKFQKEFGGEIHTFNETLNIAKKGLQKENKALDEKRTPIAIKGKKAFETMCDTKQMKDFNSIGEAKQYLIDNKVCKNLNPQMLQAVSIYLHNPLLASEKSKMIEVPSDAKCPVCGMYVSKYPKWVAQIKINDGHTHYFDGVKDMMKFYFEPIKYEHNHTNDQIEQINVTDYYTLESIDGKNAFYVIGSNVYGPMGEELIPFKNEEQAKRFMTDHFGKSILKFEEIKKEILF